MDDGPSDEGQPTDERPPVDDVVAGLIDDKPSRPKLSVVPPLAEAVAAARGKPPADDPLADVLDGPAPPPPEPEQVADAFTEARPPADELPSLNSLLDLNTLSDGLRQIANWIDKQIPAFQQTVAQFLTTIEHSVVITPDGIKVSKKVASDDATGEAAADGPVLVSVPADAAPAAETAESAASADAAPDAEATESAASAAPAEPKDLPATD